MNNSKISSKLALLASGVAVIAAAHTSRARAETAPASNVAQLDTIVVTARKQTERLMDVPVSANVMNAQALQRYATADLPALAAELPQVNIAPTNAGPGAVIAIRGISSSGADAGIAQEVTVNIDGVPVSRGRVIKQAMFDLNSVEVLKGPQALYFGKNSPAGVITLNSQAPGTTFSGYAKAGYEFRGDEWIAETAVNLPLNDVLAARIAFRASDMTGGYIKNIGGPITSPALVPAALQAFGLTLPGPAHNANPGSKSYAGRLTVAFRPSSNFDATLRVLAGTSREHSSIGGSVIWSCGPGQTNVMTLNIFTRQFLVDPYAPCNGQGLKLRGNSYGVPPAQVLKSFRDTDSGSTFNKVPSLLTSLTMNYNPSPVISLTSVTGFYKFNAKYITDNSFSTFAMAPSYQTDDFKQWTQEFHGQTSFSGPINFGGGLYFEDTRRSYDVEALIAYAGPDPVTGQWSMFQSHDQYTDKTYSAFGEMRWKLLPNLELAGGARYTKEKMTGDLNQFYARLVAAPGRVTGNFSNDNLSPQATLTWRPNAHLMLYGAYKKAFKAGGFASPAILPANGNAQNQSFGPEKVKGFEIGAKFTALDNRLAGDLTAYRYEFTDLQVSAFNAQSIAFFIQNAASALQRGVEANLRFKATPELELNGSVGYNESNYVSFPNSQCWAFQALVGTGCASGVQDLSGRPLSLAPKWVALAGASYNRAITSDIDMRISSDVRYSSSYYLQPTLSPYSRESNFFTINASVRFTRADWEIALIGKNLTDKYYAVFGQDKTLGPPGQTAAYLGAPRTYQIEVTRRF